MPYFNTTTGEMHDGDLYQDTPDAIASGPPPAPTPSPTPSPTPRADATVGRLTPQAIAQMTQEQRDAWLERSREARKDPHHPTRDDRHPEHAAALEEFYAVTMGGAAHPPVLEVFANGQSRHPDAEADGMQFATLPEAPEGRPWDPIARDGLQALAKDTPGVAEAVDHGYRVVADAQRLVDARVKHSDQTYARLLEERWPHPATQDVHLDNARYVLEVLGADDEPWTRALADHLDALWAWDPRVPIFLAERVYPVLRDAPVGPLVGEMLLRAGATWSAREAEGRARAAQAQQTPEGDDADALAGFLSMQTAATLHERRAGRTR